MGRPPSPAASLLPRRCRASRSADPVVVDFRFDDHRPAVLYDEHVRETAI